jgi:hypothetical protein
VLKKFYRGNNTIIGVTFANENLVFALTQTGGPLVRRDRDSDQVVQGADDADGMTLLYCRESLL